MRSQALLRRSRLLLKSSQHRAQVISSRPPRPVTSARPPSPATSSPDSLLPSSDSPSQSSPLPPPPGDEGPPNLPSPPEEPEKPKLARRGRQSPTTTSTKDAPLAELPEALDILWTPGSNPPDGEPSDSTILPPPEIFEEVLHNLLVTLHPQTQHRAAYSTPLGAPKEPTLALYCPIEGGDYIIDATVEELARRTGAEVLVIDAVQLAAGEWGEFGPAANSIQLPRNPLHFTSSSPSSPRPSNKFVDDYDDPSSSAFPQHMMLTVLAPSRMGGSSLVASSRRSSSDTPPSKVKVFFDSLVNLRSKQEASDSSSNLNRPRLVYIRDFPTLSTSSSSWYPPLLSAIRQRRKGALPKENAPIANPMTIIFGITPPLAAPSDASLDGGGVIGLLMSRQGQSSPISSSPKSEKNDWSEGPIADKAREKRLRHRLRKWERGDNVLLEELPKFSTTDEEVSENGESKSEVIFVGSNNNIPSLPPSSRFSSSSSQTADDPSFFRTSILVPTARSPGDERDCRVARRREINELTMRMGVGAVGGVLQKEGAYLHLSPEKDAQDAPSSDHDKMWDDWGRRVETWTNVRRVADRALGTVIASQASESQQQQRATLDPTVVSWSEIDQAWCAVNRTLDIRKAWLKDSLPPRSKNEEDEDEEEETQQQEGYDEIVDKVKNDPDLDPHEQRLLPSIVDAASMTTTFSRVHLPAHTIDSVRSIVSLPLLHPEAFQHGILKEHAMTGCLLFGPPGTGKTLVVRALAKEAGCRMMVISPSDVMDMYVGEGEKLVRATFSLARKLSPCVIFLDEIDALFGARTSNRENGGAVAHRGVITEFMQEMDGLKSSKGDNVIVIGATNRPFDLDDAVLRRLPRRLLVDLPGEKEREEIMKILLRDEQLDPNVDLKSLAKRTESFSGSDLKHLCVSAALDSVKEHVKLPWITLTSEVANTPNTEVASSVTLEQSGNADDQFIVTEVKSTTAQGPTSQDQSQASNSSKSPSQQLPEPAKVPRIITQRNFDKALKEITPSSSETLGSLSELRRWNEEFGEGNKERRKRLVWGKGRFGFNDRSGSVQEEIGRVAPSPASETSIP
ncbi:AAA-domain-containing protein [Dendrothele bispora CBS 962.96]|uniref:AAA-domain-containing protein n=1 Tax=Dendrothele bispora (strain CBS 962.96) TaxID=1314807 RepID=A0A4S8LDH1_DENBC|nr:AAA-domain-containing protein [Dendrothele bispora CBS 962.96]